MKYQLKYKYTILLTLIFVLTVFIISLFNNGEVWGSETDWINQHFAIPEYFRTKFYKDGDIFPDFAMNIGGGQNIYNFAYYGLFNPFYLFSYLMPWIKMADYVQVMSLILVYISCILCMRFMNRHFDRKISFFLAVLFMFSPVMFHSHRHIMFMNYFPFLFMGLYASENLEMLKNKVILILSAYFIMCTSFYFSISIYFVMITYIIYFNIKIYGKSEVKLVLRKVLTGIKSIFLGVIISGFLWLPVFFTLLTGREKNSTFINFFKLVIPNMNADYILYSPYSMGMTGVSLIVIISMMFSKEFYNKFLSLLFILISCFPVIVYCLNGTMYTESKILIPFIPLMLILYGEFLKVKTNIFKTLIFLVPFIASYFLFNYKGTVKSVLLICDLIISVIVILNIKKYGKNIFCVSTAVLSFICCITVNSHENFVKKEEIQEIYSEEINTIVEKTIASDDNFYRFANDNTSSVNRIYNAEYYDATVYSSVNNKYFRDFRFDTSAGENQCRNNALQTQPYNEIFNIIMGCKYRISQKDNMMYGETLEDKTEKYRLFKNKYALPIGYASDNLMSEEQFNSLSWEQKTEALLRNIITKESKNTIYPDMTSEIKLNFDELCSSEKIRKVNEAYEIRSDIPFGTCIRIDSGNITSSLMMLKFRADNRIGDKNSDIYVTVNGVKNKLSNPEWKYNNKNYDFTYVLSSDKPVESLMFEFSEGNYIVSDFELFTIDEDLFENIKKDNFITDRSLTGGDIIEGEIDVTNDGWFNLSLPYDKGFSIKVDDVKTEYFKTNTAFIGFPIKAGHHHIKIEYNAPFKLTGILISSAGFIIMIFYIISVVYNPELKIKKKKKKESILV